MAASWDRRPAAQQAALQEAALRRQLTDAVGPFSPFWREQLATLGIRAGELRTAAGLARLPAVGERDLCPDGDPALAARLVLQADEPGWVLHSAGPDLRQAMAVRVAGAAAYRRRVEAAVRPVSFHLGGQALTFPVASTRADLELIARAGARTWAVLGLDAADVLVSALPPGPTLENLALGYAALGAGAPALHAGGRAAELLRYLPATVLAVPDAAVLDRLRPAALPPSVTTVLVTGDPAGVAALVPQARVLRVWGPPDGRVLYAQCREGGVTAGFHTYPDLDLWQTVDPATAEPAPIGELVLTQLGFRGSALLRWRTGAWVDEPLVATPCPACGRTVPQIPATLAPAGAVPVLRLAGSATGPRVDLRAAAGALAGRPDLAGWQVQVRASRRDGSGQLLVRIAVPPEVDAADAAVRAGRDVQAAAGVSVTQFVLDPAVAGRASVSRPGS